MNTAGNIPLDKHQSSADGDMDGFTDWEEYRGFGIGGSHITFDETRADFNLLDIYPDREVIRSMLSNWTIQEPIEGIADGEGWVWLDTECHTGASLSNNPLCNSGMPTNLECAHQGVLPRDIYLDGDHTPHDGDGRRILGVCQSSVLGLGCGQAGILVTLYDQNIRALIQELVDDQRHRLPEFNREPLLEELWFRIWIHELGEALGLQHNETTGWDCVMNDVHIEHCPDEGEWAWFHFLPDSINFCGQNPRLRP